MSEIMEERITRLLLNHAQRVPSQRPLPLGLSIRADLAIESLSLVSVLVDLGAELETDIVEAGIELGRIETVGDLIAVGNQLAAAQRHA
jgi:hypothetical protein